VRNKPRRYPPTLIKKQTVTIPSIWTATYLSTTALIKTWQPFASLIEKTLHKKVIIKTAPDFRSFIQRTAEGRYDLLMTAPHFAALAVKTHGYRVIAGHAHDLAGDIVVAKTATFQSINDLRGKTIVTPDPLAAVSLLMELTLRQYDLTPNKDIRIKTTASHNTRWLMLRKDVQPLPSLWAACTVG